MSETVVDTYKLKAYAGRIDSVNVRISRLDHRMDSLYWRVGLLGLWNLIQADLLTCYSRRLASCSDYLKQTAIDFENAEKYILRFDPLNFKGQSAADVWFKLINSDNKLWKYNLKKLQKAYRGKNVLGMIGFGAAASALFLMETDAWDAFWAGDMSYSDEKSNFSASVKPQYGEYKNKKVEKIVKQDEVKKKGSNEAWGKNNLKDEKWYKKNGTILDVEGKAEIEGSVFDAEVSGDNGWAEGSAGVKGLTAEGHATAAAGLYVYEADKNGKVKRIFSPGVDAEVGASVAVVQAEAEGRVGIGKDKKMLGIYGEADASALSAEAKLKGSFNRNEAYLGASAEADLAKVSGSAGVSVLGTDVGVNGSLKVGVGAHAEVGYSDGKFKVDVGAAVGVGVDVGLEIDVSGTIDAISGSASSALPNLFWKSLLPFPFGLLF